MRVLLLLLGRVSGGGEQEGCDCPGQLPAWLGVTGGTVLVYFRSRVKAQGLS